MVGTQLASKLGNFGFKPSGLGAGDGASTQRSNYQTNKESGLSVGGYAVDKSFVSSSGGLGLTQGAVGGIGGGGLDNSLIKNILSTPSSEKSVSKSSTFSPEEYKQ